MIVKLSHNLLALISILLLISNTLTNSANARNIKNVTLVKSFNNKSIGKINTYSAWNLQSSGLSKEAFELAEIGYSNLIRKNFLQNRGLLTIIDYSKPSSQKRLFVLDMTKGKVLFNTLVAHGQNSGYNYATEFSNDQESHKSSLGFYITLNTYIGENGYSLKLKGCEKGINDNAYNRSIVIHGAEYVSQNYIKSNGFLGRSWGCPALPLPVSKTIIDKIKNGSCVFVYSPSKKYLSKSRAFSI